MSFSLHADIPDGQPWRIRSRRPICHPKSPIFPYGKRFHYCPLKTIPVTTQSPYRQNGPRRCMLATATPSATDTQADLNRAVLGGFLISVILAATRKYIDAKFGEGRYPDPISVFVQFLRPIPAGKVFVVCQILRSSSRQCVIKVELSTTKPSSTESSDSPSAEGGRCSTVAIITQGDLSKENGVSQETKPIIAADLPNRETQCTQITDPIVEATPVTSKLRWIAPRSPDGLWGHRLGGHIREVWLSFKDGSKIDTLALGLLSDTVSS